MSDFRIEAAYLGALPAEKTVAVRNAIQFGANTIKNTWRASAVESSGKHARLYPYKITYDTRVLKSGIVAEIGPVAEGQGELGPVLEYGSQHRPPTLDGLRALTDAHPRIERALDLVMAFDGATGVFG
jgi:hypothetical protein